MMREPDLERVRRAHALLSSNASRGMAALETLANEGSVLSMLYLAQAHQFGPYADSAKAERWYRSAYERGSATALFSLGSIAYRRGDYATAERYFAEGASKDDGPSTYWLATIYLTHPSQCADAEQVRVLLERAIKTGQIRAKHGLGLLYLRGQFGIRYIPRGIWLFVAGMIDAFRTTFRDPSNRRLW